MMPTGAAFELVRLRWRGAGWLLVEKPAGLPTTAPPPRPGFSSPRGPRCLLDVVRTRWHPHGTLHPTSRLDAPVSGLVLFATNRRSTAEALRWREEGRYRRLYVALASGAAPEHPGGVWRRAIGLHPSDRRLRWVEGDPRHPIRASREAETRWQAGPWLRDVAVGWLWLVPRTGRTHQLRVHAAAAHLPLLGDVAYGGPRRLVAPDGHTVTCARVLLHCTRLDLPLPDEARAACHAPPPPVFEQVWRRLGGASPLPTPPPLEPSSPAPT